MKRLKTFCNYIATMLFLAVSMYGGSAYADDIVVVVSARSLITHLTSEQVANIFLGKTDVFPNNTKAIPVDQAEESSIKEDFYLKIANRSPSQLAAYWTKSIFTGNGFPPKMLNDSVAVIKTIANNSKAIGYVYKNEVDKSIRVVLVP